MIIIIIVIVVSVVIVLWMQDIERYVRVCGRNLLLRDASMIRIFCVIEWSRQRHPTAFDSFEQFASIYDAIRPSSSSNGN